MDEMRRAIEKVLLIKTSSACKRIPRGIFIGIAKDWKARVRFPAEQDFSTASKLALGPIQSPIQWVSGAISPMIKRPELEADHSTPSNAEVKNDEALRPLFMA
jgi:hypothetical protein